MSNGTAGNATVEQIGGTLAVPIDLEVFAANDGVAKGEDINRWVPNFNLSHVNRSPEPPPFSNSGSNNKVFNREHTTTAINTGIYAHFRLPRALCHALQDRESRAIQFPKVPNRWLVLRHAIKTDPPNGGDASAHAAWIVESDFVHHRTGSDSSAATRTDPNLRDQGSPFPDPYSEILNVTRIGQKTELSKWTEAGDPMFLDSTGLGLLAFHEYQPYNQDVLSIHDPLDKIDKAQVSYLVVGWHSDASHDVIEVGRKWIEDDMHAAKDPGSIDAHEIDRRLLDLLDWEIVDAVQGAVPKHSMYYGRALGVGWDRKGPKPSDNKPKTQDVMVGLGDTMTSIVHEFLAKKLQDPNAGNSAAVRSVSNLLDPAHEALAGDDIARRRYFHEQSFTRMPGGTVWNIHRHPVSPASSSPVSAPSWSVEVCSTDLAALNRKQKEFDEATRLLHALQWRLYSLWGTQGLPKISSQVTREELTRQCETPDVPSGQETAASQVHAQQETVVMLDKEITDTRKSITAKLDEENKKISTPNEIVVLEPESLPPFYRPMDPVLGLWGIFGDQENVQNRESAPLSKDKCRLSIEGVPAQILAGTKDAISATEWGKLPPQISGMAQKVYHETLRLIDIRNAAASSGSGNGGAEEYRKKLTEAKMDKVPLTAEWHQPWIPVLVEWKGEYNYIPYLNGQPADDSSGKTKTTWKFVDDHYECTDKGGTQRSRDKNNQVETVNFEGRQLLSTLPLYNLDSSITALEKFATTDAMKKQYQKIREDVAANWSMHSVTLNGFNQQIASRDPAPNVSAPPRLRNLIGSAGDVFADRGPVKAAYDSPDQTEFVHMRGGYFKLTQLRVVDRFGRTLDLKEARPVLSDALTPKPTVDIGMGVDEALLRPRLLQGARVRFEATSNNRDNVPIDLISRTSPICGWIVPLPLEKAVACYDPDGHALGSIRLGLEKPDNKGIRKVGVKWEPLPTDSPHPALELGPSAELREHSPHLFDFATKLLGGGEANFLSFLASLDDGVSGSAPSTAPSGNQLLSLMAGRPLALIRARLRLELDGPPIYDPAWPYIRFICSPEFFKPDTAPDHVEWQQTWDSIAKTLGYAFPVRLGEGQELADGLIGYFTEPRSDANSVDTSYDTFYTVRKPLSDNNSYVQWIERSQNSTTDPTDSHKNYLHLRPIPAVPGNYHQGASARVFETHVTLICDPRSAVHATTDLLPVSTLKIPDRHIEPALATMRASFRFAPLMSSTRIASAPENSKYDMVLPLPNLGRGEWTWAERADPATGTWHEQHVVAADSTPHFNELLPTSTAETDPTHESDRLAKRLGVTLRSGFMTISHAFGDHTAQATPNQTPPPPPQTRP